VLIEQAKGVIAERYSMSQPDAFTWLRSLARNERGKLRDVAQRIVMSTSQSPALGGIGLHSDLVDSAGR
jgi:AmiR/NasT family two-component response regulator